MRLLPVIALTLWLAGASARVGEDPYRRFRKEYGKGLAVEAESRPEDDEADDDDSDEDEEQGDDDSGKTKETSVHRKHFMDQYFLQSGPVQYEFGHVCEDPKEWEQRYEKKDFDKNRHQGQVKWGDANGRHGEHYWDFNHDGNLEDEGPEWYNGGRQEDFSRYSDSSREYDSRGKDGNKARGIIKEKLTITKKKNGRTVDQTKINMEKLADLDDIIQKHDPKPFAGDKSLIEEFNRKTQGVKKKTPFNDFDNDDSDKSKEYFSFNDDIRRMGKLPLPEKPLDKTQSQAVNTKKFNVEEQKDIQRRYDVFPDMGEKEINRGEISTTITHPADLISKATINIDTEGKVHLDPITGSLTDSKTGRKFKIFGVLVDS